MMAHLAAGQNDEQLHVNGTPEAVWKTIAGTAAAAQSNRRCERGHERIRFGQDVPVPVGVGLAGAEGTAVTLTTHNSWLATSPAPLACAFTRTWLNAADQ